MARMKFLCDADRCIECNACVTACKNEHDVPWGINRRRVVTINDGKPGERSISMACMHCTDPPCAAVCPVDCFYTDRGRRWCCTRRTCASAAATASTPARSARRSTRGSATSARRGKMDKCTFCAGGPEADSTEPSTPKYGANRLAEGKLPLCAEMCSTKALLAGDGDIIADIYKERVTQRGFGSGAWGWQTAYHETDRGLTGGGVAARCNGKRPKEGGEMQVLEPGRRRARRPSLRTILAVAPLATPAAAQEASGSDPIEQGATRAAAPRGAEQDPGPRHHPEPRRPPRWSSRRAGSFRGLPRGRAALDRQASPFSACWP